MSINTRFAAMLPAMLAEHGFTVTLQSSTPAAGGDYDTGTPTWDDVDDFPAVWDKTGSGYERLGEERARSQGRMAMLIAYRDDLKDNATVANKRISYNGSLYNIASVGMLGDRVGLSLTLEDGVAT